MKRKTATPATREKKSEKKSAPLKTATTEAATTTDTDAPKDVDVEKLERNRLCAKQHREKKKRELADARLRIAELVSENARLAHELAMLRAASSAGHYYPHATAA